jgi:hypothetical protein
MDYVAQQESAKGAPADATQPAEQEHGYLVPTDALERLERLVGVLSEPLVAFTAELAAERDEARERARVAEDRTNRLLKAMQAMVDAWPQTSWGTSEEARDTAAALLDEIGQEGATIGAPDSPPIQENPAHAPSRPHDDGPST